MIQDTVVIGGECSLETRIEGDCDLTSMVEGDPDVLVVEGGGIVYPHYSGSYTVTPSTTAQVLDTDGKVMDDDVTVNAVTAGSATTPATIITANPSISVSSGGLITATVSKTQQITPTVQEGYVSAGTAGNVGVSGSNTEQLTTQAAQTIYPSANDQSIASGKYLTGAQTFKAVTVSGLSADKILTGTTVKIGDADDDDRIANVVGTAQGGITPTGTKSITANGTSIDVYSYQYADVAVPNSYSASDEGKVVSNGALVSQTSDTVTANDTYDTTLINSLTVNVSGGGGYTIADIASLNVTGAITIDETSIPTVKEYAFRGYKDITSLTIVGSPILQNYCFANCTGITTFTADTLTRFYKDSYNNSMYALSGCTGLTVVCLKGYGNYSLPSYTFYNCTGLTTLDIANCSGIQATFGGCSSLRTLILRRTDAITALSQSGQNGVGGIYNNPNDSVIYVPQALLSTYQSASNWSALYALNNNIFQKIEGTTYATHWADGTVITT